MSQRLGLRSLNKHVALQNLSIYYTWKKNKLILKTQYNNNKLKIIAPTWNDEFELQMVLILCQVYIQDYIKYIIKKHEALTKIPPILVCINKINNRLVFKIKDGYKLELQTP